MVKSGQKSGQVDSQVKVKECGQEWSKGGYMEISWMFERWRDGQKLSSDLG